MNNFCRKKHSNYFCTGVYNIIHTRHSLGVGGWGGGWGEGWVMYPSLSPSFVFGYTLQMKSAKNCKIGCAPQGHMLALLKSWNSHTSTSQQSVQVTFLSKVLSSFLDATWERTYRTCNPFWPYASFMSTTWVTLSNCMDTCILHCCSKLLTDACDRYAASTDCNFCRYSPPYDVYGNINYRAITGSVIDWAVAVLCQAGCNRGGTNRKISTYLRNIIWNLWITSTLKAFKLCARKILIGRFENASQRFFYLMESFLLLLPWEQMQTNSRYGNAH